MTEADYLNAVELLRVTEYELREYIKRNASRKGASGVKMGELDNAHCSLIEVLRLLSVPEEEGIQDTDEDKLEEDADYIQWLEEKSWEGRE